MELLKKRRLALLSAASAYVLLACALQRPGGLDVHRWQAGLGPVVPHENFPSDCSLCHVGGTWNVLKDDFAFDHEKETGVPLTGSHAQAQCLRCHNDRGAVQVFTERGCAGCHEDVHQGWLGPRCDECHQEVTWQAVGQIERHAQTRFPLNGVHAFTACQACHFGADSGRFTPLSNECVSCHYDNLQAAVIPDHFAFGWVDNCDRCHLPTSWNEAQSP